MLIIVCGLPGSGKTTISILVAKRYHALHISSDAVRKELIPAPVYSEEEKKTVYDEVLRRAGAALKEGKDVIIDSTCYKKEHREMMRRLAADAGTKNYTILCTLPEEEIKRRLANRGKMSLSDADYEVYLKVKGIFEEMDEEHLVVDCSLQKKKMLEIIGEYIGGSSSGG